MKVRVYGHTGTVGRQLYHWLAAGGKCNLQGKSLDREDYATSDFADRFDYTDLAFLCLPTPTEMTDQKIDAIEQVCANLNPCRVIIRSTILPGTTRRLSELYPQHVFYHWPEFLSARTAQRDFISPQRHLVGTSGKAAEDFDQSDVGYWQAWIAPLLPRASYGTNYVSFEESEIIKYAHNVHGAMQVIFANQLYDICQNAGAKYETVRDDLPDFGGVSRDVSRKYWDVWKDGERGYGGACFPKDVDAIYYWCRENGVQAELIAGIKGANELLRGAYRVRKTDSPMAGGVEEEEQPPE